jgi:hypothetical protein
MKAPQKSLKSWTDADWDYAGKPKKSRYLPKSARDSLTSAQKAAGNRRKRKAKYGGRKYLLSTGLFEEVKPAKKSRRPARENKVEKGSKENKEK